MKKSKTPNSDDCDFDFAARAVEVPEGERPHIFSYSRAEAILDGRLRDASVMAREAGILLPVALTIAAWQAAVEVPEYALCESEEGRLWDVVNVLYWKARGVIGSEIEISLFVTDEFARPKEVELRAVCGPDELGNPVITVLLRNES